jgi:signal transduction histidine kinase
MASAAAQPGPSHPPLMPDALGALDRERGEPRSARDWLVDSAFFVLALVVGFAMFSNQVRQTHPSAGVEVAGVFAGLAACWALWLRRRWPVGVALAILPLSVLSSFAAPAGLLAFFTVAVHRRFATVAALGAAGLATQTLAYAGRLGEQTRAGNAYWLTLLVLILLHVAVAAWGMFVRARRQLLASLRERAERAEAEQRDHVERAREQERARVAREMHDVLAHRISLLSMHAGSLEFRPNAPPEEVAAAAGVIRASAHQALEDLREVIGVLRQGPADGALAPQPTLAELPALVEESRAAGMTVHAELALVDTGSAPAAVGRSAYRIVQEGLTNARKHARGATVDLTVAGGPGAGLTIELRNRLPVGRTDAEIPGAGSGLIGLAERAVLSGGRLEHGPTVDGDFRLWAWLPCPA